MLQTKANSLSYQHESEAIMEKMKKQDSRDVKKGEILSLILGEEQNIAPSSIQSPYKSFSDPPDLFSGNKSTKHQRQLFELLHEDQFDSAEGMLKPEPENRSASYSTPVSHHSSSILAQAPSLPSLSTHSPQSLPKRTPHASECAHGNYENEEEEELHYQKQMYTQPQDPRYANYTKNQLDQRFSQQRQKKQRQQQLLQQQQQKQPFEVHPQPRQYSTQHSLQQSKTKQHQHQHQQQHQQSSPKEESFSTMLSTWFSEVLELDDKPIPQRMIRVRNDHCIGLLMLTFAQLDIKKRGQIEKQRAYKHFVSLLYYAQKLSASTNQPFNTELWNSKKDDFMDMLINHKVTQFTSYNDNETIDFIDCDSWRFYIQEFDLPDPEFAQVLQQWLDDEQK